MHALGGQAGRRRPLRVLMAPLLFFALQATTTNCQKPQCSGDTQEYNGKCLSNTAVTYLECTKDRGFNTEKEIGGSVGGTFRVVADATVDIAYKRSTTENTPVALEIVKACLRISEQVATSPADKSAAQQSQRAADEALSRWRAAQVKETPHIAISPTRAKVGDQVTVSGGPFYANETVAIRVRATLVRQVKVDEKGMFQTTIKIPPPAPPPGISATITVTGETSTRSASAPFETA